MTRDEKEQRIAKPDGKIFEIKNVQIEQTYLNPNYACLHTSATVMTPTGPFEDF
jgi:hypothetical protein